MAKIKKKTWPKWPTKMIEATVKKLEDWFRSDFTDSEACAYAWISRTLFYNYYGKDKKFTDRIDSAKEYCFILAKDAVRRWLIEKDKEYALKRLKNRQNKIYSERNATEHSWEITILSESELND